MVDDSHPPVRALYVHVPFCAHRCGYCDFVTTSAQPELHARYVAGLEQEWAIRAGEAGGHVHRFDTIFIGGGTPTLLQPESLERLLRWVSALAAPGGEVTIECNPETVTPELAAMLVAGGITRVSLGAQSFQPHVLEMLERRATPDVVRAAVSTLRGAGVGQLNLDLIWAVPGQRPDDLRADLAELVALAPDHVSAYELEFKPGTRLTHRLGSAAEAVGEAADDHYDLVVDTLVAAGYDWYETANFARDGRECRHNLVYWTQGDYLGLGIGAVGTLAGTRRTNLPNLPRWLAAVEAGELPPARTEHVDEATRQLERILLALRLDRPLVIDAAELGPVVVPEAPQELARHGLATVTELPDGGVELRLHRRGRMLLNGVLDRLLVVPTAT